MKKIVLMCLVVAFASGEGIFENYFKNEERMRESLKPSFDCSKAKDNSAEDFICQSKGGQVAPSVIFIDNLFTLYYKIIIKHTPQAKKRRD